MEFNLRREKKEKESPPLLCLMGFKMPDCNILFFSCLSGVVPFFLQLSLFTCRPIKQHHHMSLFLLLFVGIILHVVN